MFLLPLGGQGILDNVDLNTDVIKIGLFAPATTDAAIKAITGATNANPIVITAASHGFANGDYVYIDGIVGNLAANGLWKVANQTTNTFEITRFDGTGVVGSGAYSSGGFAVCLGPSAAGDNLDDFSAAMVGTAQTLGSVTLVNGVFDAADPVFSSVASGTIYFALLWKDTGTESTSLILFFLTSKHIVTCNTQANSSATAIPVEPLTGAIPSGTVLTFSNGVSATLSGAAAAGDRSLAVSALAANVTAGSVAMAPSAGTNVLPLTANGGNITPNFATAGIYRTGRY